MGDWADQALPREHPDKIRNIPREQRGKDPIALKGIYWDDEAPEPKLVHPEGWRSDGQMGAPGSKI